MNGSRQLVEKKDIYRLNTAHSTYSYYPYKHQYPKTKAHSPIGTKEVPKTEYCTTLDVLQLKTDKKPGFQF